MGLRRCERKKVVAVAGHEDQAVLVSVGEDFRVTGFDGQRLTLPNHAVSLDKEDLRDAVRHVVIKEEIHAGAAAIWVAIWWSISAR